MVFPQVRPRRSGLWFSFGLIAGATTALYTVWFWVLSRLGGEIVQAVTSRGNPPRYRHRIRWR